MGKLYDQLQRQLKSVEYKKDAEDCLHLYEILKEISGGYVFIPDWDRLTTFSGYIGHPPHIELAMKPSKLGYALLNGVGEKKECKEKIRRISVRAAIASHLSEIQKLMSMTTRSGMISADFFVTDNRKAASAHIDFTKQLISTYPDTSIEVSEEELRRLWNKAIWGETQG